MKVSATLTEKREELKSQITSRKYRTLAEAISDEIGRRVQSLGRLDERILYWLSLLIVALVVFLLGLLVSTIAGEPLSRELILVEIWTLGMGVSFIIALRLVSQGLFTTYRTRVIDSINSIENLQHLQSSFSSIFDIRRQLIVSLLVGVAVGGYMVFVWDSIKGSFPGFGPSLIAVFVGIQGASVLYFFPPIFFLQNRVSKFQLKLYFADPSSSEVIDYLADITNSTVLAIAIIFVLITIGLAYFELLNVTNLMLWLLIAWTPLVAIFANGHRNLASLIIRVKRQSLKDIQDKVEKLREQLDDIPTKEGVEHLRALIDYHDQVKATRNSAIDLRTGLNFINSLLLPLLGFLLGNIDRVLQLIF